MSKKPLHGGKEFESLAKVLVQVPKKQLDKQVAKWRDRKKKRRKK